MKIFEVSPFFNEEFILDLRIANSKGIVDEFHVLESNRSHKFNKKKYYLPINSKKNLVVHRINGALLFKRPGYMLKKNFPFFCKYKYAMHNDGVQRSYLNTEYLNLKFSLDDKDILISSDIDEFLDFKKIDFLLDSVKKHGIISVNCYETMYFFNLFNHELRKQNINARNWSMRIFIMTGKYFKNSKLNLHQLRFKGVMNQLNSEIHLLKGYYGFHHSFMPTKSSKAFLKKHALDVDNKIKNYSHFEYELNTNVLSQFSNVKKNINYLDLIKSKKSFLNNSYLKKNNSIKLLPVICQLKKKYPYFFC
jgi:hypothetical protein